MDKELENKQKNNLPPKLKLYFDGACENFNPGGTCSYGWIVKDMDDNTLKSGQGIPSEEGDPRSTNNYAEYAGLGFGLRWLADQNWQGELEIYGDSKLIINQLTQEWACNKLHLQKLRQRCWDLLEKLGNKYTATWIPREENGEADALTRNAWENHTGKKFPERIKRKKKP